MFEFHKYNFNYTNFACFTGEPVQNLFSYTNRGSKADYGRMPRSRCFENKDPRV